MELYVEGLEEIIGQINDTRDQLGSALEEIVARRYGDRLAESLTVPDHPGGIVSVVDRVAMLREEFSDLPLGEVERFSVELGVLFESLGAFGDIGEIERATEIIGNLGAQFQIAGAGAGPLSAAGVALDQLIQGAGDATQLTDALRSISDSSNSLNVDAWREYTSALRAGLQESGDAAALASGLNAELSLIETNVASSSDALLEFQQALLGKAVGDGSRRFRELNVELEAGVNVWQLLRDVNPGDVISGNLEALLSLGEQAFQSAQQNTATANVLRESIENDYLGFYETLTTAGETLEAAAADASGEADRVGESARLSIGELLELGTQVVSTGDVIGAGAPLIASAVEEAGDSIQENLGDAIGDFERFGDAAVATAETIGNAFDQIGESSVTMAATAGRCYAMAAMAAVVGAAAVIGSSVDRRERSCSTSFGSGAVSEIRWAD